MEKFSYALEFYKEGIFDLDNVELFKRKVNEAEKVELYFSKLIPNIEYIRPYIIMSYKLEKVIGYENRIRYVRGLIYASDYIDFNDAINVANDIDMFYENELLVFDTEKRSIWKEMEYTENANYDKYLSGKMEDLFEIEEDLEEDKEEVELENNLINISKRNYVEIDSNAMNTIYKLVSEYIDEDENDKEINDDEEEYDDEIEYYIPVDEKLRRFKKNSDIYIENIINAKLKNNVIKKEDVPMIKRAMKRWFKKVFYIIEKLVQFDDIEYKYNDKNIIKFL